MSKKIAVAVITLILLPLMFSIVPVARAPPDPIRIGIIGPVGLPHMYPGGMWDGASLAVNEINAAGGVDVGGVMTPLALDMGDEHAVDLDPVKAQAEVTRLITVQGDKFLIGGFRTEVTTAMIETAMDHQTPFFICGAATDELLSTTVPVNYARYKYLYRQTPLNSTCLGKTMFAFIQGWLIPTELLPIYGDYLWPGAPNKQVKIGVLVEDLAWTNGIWFYMTTPAIYPLVFGPNANVTYSARIPDGATNYDTYTSGLINNDCRLAVIVFSGVDGIPLINAMETAGVKAISVGINVLGQLQSHWASTGGACDYEAMLAFAGTRTPIVGDDVTGKTVKFWDDFLAYTQATYGTAAWPIYTAWGAYDGVYGIKEAIEAADTTDADTLVPVFESTDRITLAGRFRFTPIHDVYAGTAEVQGPYATGNTRAMMVQWRNFTKTQGPVCDVVWPLGASYSRMVRLPPEMYPYQTDIYDGNPDIAVCDGKVDIKDIGLVAKAFGKYVMVADLDNNGKIDIKDVARVAKDFGKSVTLPYDPDA